jgi:hypothetical protein
MPVIARAKAKMNFEPPDPDFTLALPVGSRLNDRLEFTGWVLWQNISERSAPGGSAILPNVPGIMTSMIFPVDGWNGCPDLQTAIPR